jgi:predicted secreted protein
LLSQQGEAEFKSASSALGSGGIVTLRFKAMQPGNMKLKLIYHRTFEKNVPPIKSYEIGLVVEK